MTYVLVSVTYVLLVSVTYIILLMSAAYVLSVYMTYTFHYYQWPNFFRISAINDISLASKFRVTVYFDGIVLWIPSVTLNTSCDMDLTNFPFDTQKCSIIITNWIYSAKLLQFLPDSDEVLLVAFQNSSDWFLDKTNVTQKIENFADIELAMIIFEARIQKMC